MASAPEYASADASGAVAPLNVTLLTALAYAVAGLAALLLAGSPGSASPLFPAAGIALAAVLRYGRTALPGVLLGALVVNVVSGVLRGQTGLTNLFLPLLLATGATLQAAVGAALVRRHVAQPLVLSAPRDILRFGLLGALLACCVSASVATLALLAIGTLSAANAFSVWSTWWVGDALGVLVAAPLVLTLIGQPQADWRPRRRTVGVPLLIALALLAIGLAELGRLDAQRLQAGFDRDADRLASAAEARLAVPLYALQALRGAAYVRVPLDQDALVQAAHWWLTQHPTQLLAMGYSERVALQALPQFEAAAQSQGPPGRPGVCAWLPDRCPASTTADTAVAPGPCRPTRARWAR
jgi:hypothetical protein